MAPFASWRIEPCIAACYFRYKEGHYPTDSVEVESAAACGIIIIKIIGFIIWPYQKYKANTKVQVDTKKTIEHVYSKSSPLQLSAIWPNYSVLFEMAFEIKSFKTLDDPIATNSLATIANPIKY